MTVAVRRHEPTEDCSGIPQPRLNLGPTQPPISTPRCVECGQALCPCEVAHGHDCEA